MTENNHPETTKTIAIDLKLLAGKRIIVGSHDTSLVDSYKVLRTQVFQRTAGKNARTFMITSPGGGEGKTLTALNMAISFSQEIDRTVLLVEADFRNPSLRGILNLDRDLPGLADYLLDGAPVRDVLLRPNIAKLVILPAGRRLHNSAELLGSQRMKELVRELRERYNDRYVIFDTPPVLASADALVFSDMVDAVLMVVEAEKTPADKINKAKNLLEGKNLIGLVLNKVRHDSSLSSGPS